MESGKWTVGELKDAIKDMDDDLVCTVIVIKSMGDGESEGEEFLLQEVSTDGASMSVVCYDT